MRKLYQNNLLVPDDIFHEKFWSGSKWPFPVDQSSERLSRDLLPQQIKMNIRPSFKKPKKEKKLLKEVEKVKKESSAIKRCCCTILWCNKSMSHTYESFTYLFPLQVFSFLLLDQLRSFHFLWYLARTCPFFRSTFQGSTDQNRAIC